MSWLPLAAGEAPGWLAEVAGLVVGAAVVAYLGEILPLQIVFSALFFVSIGMLLELGLLVDNLPAVVGAILAVLVVKAVTTGVAARALGEPVAVAAAAALLLAQVGEFSFVLERAGADAGLSPAGLGDDGSQGFLAAAVLLLIATPWLAQGGVRPGGRMKAAPAPRAPSGTEPAEGTGVAEGLDGHVVIAGYGRVARLLAGALLRGGVPHVVTTLSPDGAAEAQRRGLRVLLGDSSRTRTMEEAGIRRARFVVIADDEPEMGARIAGVARALNAEAKVVVRTRYHSDTGDLKAAGATYVVSDETEGTVRLSEKLLTRYDVALDQVEQYLVNLRAPAAAHVADTQPRPRFTRTVVDTESVIDPDFDRDACAHMADTRAVVPSAPGCEECLRDGTDWVHLRLCMECGHVGCCDSSPNRHARRHWEETGHAIIRSAEPRETWGPCFPDDLRLEPVRTPA